MSRVQVKFLPDNVTVSVPAGTDLLQAAALAGLEVKSGCGGEGVCGRCLVNIRQGRARVGEGNMAPKYRRLGYVLACRTRVEQDLVVEIPPEARIETTQQVLVDEPSRLLQEKETDALVRYGLQPLCRKFSVALSAPTLVENAPDLARLVAKLGPASGYSEVTTNLSVLRELPEVLRREDFRVTCTLADLGDGRAEIVHLEPGEAVHPAYGLAVDIGTTTVAAHLVDLASGETLERVGTYNHQIRYGDDVITRIIHSVREERGLEELQQAAVGTINELIDRLLARQNLWPSDIQAVVVAGNTTMTHLFLGVSPKYLRLEPYIPAAARFPTVKAGELGLKVHPEAPVRCMPAVASYLGGDIVSGLLVSGMHQLPGISLYIDIGTNGEMVLGGRDFLVGCACSAGPAFEGSGITCGMRATAGAIDGVAIDPETLEARVHTVGGEKPLGICGSGLVDLLARMWRAGIIDRAGNFQRVSSPRVRWGDEGPEYVLAWRRESGSGRDVVITEADVKNLLRSKGAVYAGIRSLLRSVDMEQDAVEKVWIAGGFGNYLNIRAAIRIGLLPDLPPEKFVFLGNASVKGARLALLSGRAWQEAERVAQGITYLELSVGNTFMDEFVSALFLPHTDLRLFPSLEREEVEW
ncbi:MAG: ASKHA domain-containing protein [Bacillota bacterium]|nr:ASKHA domain-containing protein [Bacillota bacterium]